MGRLKTKIFKAAGRSGVCSSDPDLDPGMFCIKKERCILRGGLGLKKNKIKRITKTFPQIQTLGLSTGNDAAVGYGAVEGASSGVDYGGT